MEEDLSFEELYNAYLSCLKRKKNKVGTYSFVNTDLCKNLINLLDSLNNRTYTPKSSNCYVVTDPTYREIFAADFSDRVVQHFYMSEINNILESELVHGCCSCRENKGTDYALKLLKDNVVNISGSGSKDCYFLKIDLSGYFMSINRKQVSDKFYRLIENKYKGKHKDLLLYLTPSIFLNNPSLNCNYKCSDKVRNMVPERRRMKQNSICGLAIGNLVSQAASNLNLSDFDKFVTKDLGLTNYVRYVDDIIIVSDSKERLRGSYSLIIDKLKETNQIVNTKKTRIDTVYHGITFLGRITYPYGYQKPSKKVIARTLLRKIEFDNKFSLLSSINSSIGILKNYNCRKLMFTYVDKILNRFSNFVSFDNAFLKFSLSN